MNNFFYLYRDNAKQKRAAKLLLLLQANNGAIMATKARGIVGHHGFYKARSCIEELECDLKREGIVVKLVLFDSKISFGCPVIVDEWGDKWRVSWQIK